MTTIKLRRGTGVPDSLEYGEVAVDTTAKIMYAGAANGDIVELSGGDVDWNQIINLPDWIIEIDPNKPDSINIAELQKQVDSNTEEVGKLQTDVGQLWSAVHEVSSLATAALQKAEENAGLIAKNAEEIEALRTEIGAIESGLTFGGVYSPVTGQITNVDQYAVDRGFSENMTLTNSTSAGQQGIYFIVSVAGTAINGDAVKAGDWLIANAMSWVVVNYGYETITIDQVAGLAKELEDLHAADDALEKRVEALETEIDGGTYTGTPPNFRS